MKNQITKTNNSMTTVVFIDAGVDNYQQLVAGVIPGAQVFVLDGNADGVEQINQVLLQHKNIDAVHIISHGAPGCLYLGNSQLSLDTLKNYASQLQQWNVSNLLLYGCNVAAGDAGEEFIAKLHALTGADIAASKTLTGSAAKGGNWELEVKTGRMQPLLALHSSAITAYKGVLGGTRISNTSLPVSGAELSIDVDTGTIYFTGSSTNGSLYKITPGGIAQNITPNFSSVSTQGGFYPYLLTDIQYYNGAVYTALSSGELLQINTTTGQTTKLANLPGFDIEAGLDIKGNQIYITDGEGSANQMLSYNLGTGILSPAISGLPSVATGLEYSPQNDRFYFANTGSGFYATDSAVGTFSLISNTSSGDGNFAIGPTGQFIYAATGTQINRISTVDGSVSTYFTGLTASNNDLALGRSSTGNGYSLYVLDNQTLVEISVDEILNQQPTDITLNNNSINENADPNTTVGTFSSTDPDTGNTFTYSLVIGTGDTDNSAFSIVNNELRINASPNFEAKSTYNIRVQTKDQGGLSFEKALVVNINDVNETPTNLTLSNNSINENVSANTTVGTFSSTDPDTGNTFTYSLVAGAGDIDNSAFSIANNNELRINASPNFEAKSSYNIRVRTTDQGGLSFEKELTVNINDVDEYVRLTPNNDVFRGTAGDEQIDGLAGSDVLYGNAGNDQILGGDGNDVVYGGDDNDSISGGLGSDRLYGDAGNDLILGDAGNDILYGGEGDDILNGGAGSDQLYGNNGRDTFVLASGMGQDIIYGFQDNLDVMQLNGDLTFDGLKIVQSGSSTLIKVLATGETLASLMNTSSALIGAADFSFISPEPA